MNAPECKRTLPVQITISFYQDIYGKPLASREPRTIDMTFLKHPCYKLSYVSRLIPYATYITKFVKFVTCSSPRKESAFDSESNREGKPGGNQIGRIRVFVDPLADFEPCKQSKHLPLPAIGEYQQNTRS